jgi:hypothetical protein
MSDSHPARETLTGDHVREVTTPHSRDRPGCVSFMRDLMWMGKPECTSLASAAVAKANWLDLAAHLQKNSCGGVGSDRHTPHGPAPGGENQVGRNFVPTWGRELSEFLWVRACYSMPLHRPRK